MTEIYLVQVRFQDDLQLHFRLVRASSSEEARENLQLHFEGPHVEGWPVDIKVHPTLG